MKTKTTQMIEAMRTEKACRATLAGIDWSGVVELLTYRGASLSPEHAAVITAMADVHTGTILAARSVLAHVGDHAGRAHPVIATVTAELVDLTGGALTLVDAESRL